MGRSRLLQLLPLVLALACLYSQFGVTAEINEIQPYISGPEGTLEAASRWMNSPPPSERRNVHHCSRT